MQRIALLGLGLMGGSLGLALKKNNFQGVVTAYARREETRSEALARGVCDEVYDNPAAAVRDADISICCVPITVIPELLDSAYDGLKPGSIVTDVGSTKGELMNALCQKLASKNVCFIGSHPLAGSEQQGLEVADSTLYTGAVVVLTPEEMAQAEMLEKLKKFWTELGAEVAVMSAAVHDRLVARTSHLPHVIAAALAAVVGREDEQSAAGLLCGTGFIDTTRIADGSPRIWRDIVETNRDNLLDELRALEMQNTKLIELLENRDFDGIEQFFEQGQAARRALLAGRNRAV